MSQLFLFGVDDDPLPPQAARLAPRLRALADQGIFFGTSSWKYEGWLGEIYTPSRYTVRGKLSERKFRDECLEEYARTFPLAGGDFSFYQFPSEESWRRLFGGTPSTLRFAFKVPEDITVRTWPGHARYGTRAGQANPAFLDPHAFERHFTRLLTPYRDRVAVLIFEFGTFAKSSFAEPADFYGHLNHFLEALPPGFRYSVEIRNPEYLGPDYFGLLASHNVAHVYSAWTRMPELDKQVAMPDAETADFRVVRALLRHGRPYEQAVQRFQPYRSIQEPYPSARAGMVQVVERARTRKQPAFLLVNNRLEGNSPGTIEAVVNALDR